ncbi:UvrD-helicase domain-containing protein [Butyrivibrio sp. AE3006]|uniref:UvrD-helicase domain-containing protein n=1 Tax=Butyrivibrio sp. AE3006 TaxID=1280673 RepID=UPI0003FB3B6D|nr:UvrD-helicase domain-containing protein [Butyrivibrio sp. AE3006]
MEKNIVITDTYMFSLLKLNNNEKKQAVSTVKQMRSDISIPSLSVHAIDREKCDPKFRSARVNSDIRLIFYVDGEYCFLLYIDHHDDAYDWCEGKYFKKTDFGATYIFDVLKEEKLLSEFGSTEQSVDYEKSVGVLESNGISQKELIKLGIAKIHAENLLTIDNDEQFVEYIEIFPEELQEALMDLYMGEKAFDVVFNEIQDAEIRNENQIDISQSLLQKDTKRRFYVTQSMEELEYLMENESFDKWTIFLHPSQEKFANIHVNGPMLVEGGPGTGKTVLGIHRAAYLAQNVFKPEDGKKILFCTYSKKLARYISDNIDKLFLQKGITNNVEVVGVDSFISQQLGANTLAVSMEKFEGLAKYVYSTQRWKYPYNFYMYEYYQVIERYGIVTLDQYLNADRTGMGVGLNENNRKGVWEFFRKLFEEQRKRGIATFVNRAEKLLYLTEKGELKPAYDAVIIDEAQDLEPCKLRAIISCVKTGPDSVMILADDNQRIFNLRSWRSDVGINVVGRTHYLYLNYRTTKEISDYATAVLFKGGDKNDYMKNYKSIVKGNDPIVQGYRDESKEREAIVATISGLIQRGTEPNQICVVFPNTNELSKFESVLDKHNIEHLFLKEDIIPQDSTGVCLCNVNGIKGLEFRVVIISAADKYGNWITNKFDDIGDPDAKLRYLKQVDCARFVAATRARDELYVTYTEG